MTWFWLNMPLAAAFFAAFTGIPLWLVLKHPDASRRPQVAAPQGHTGQITGPEAAFAPGHGEHASDAREPAHAHHWPPPSGTTELPACPINAASRPSATGHHHQGNRSPS
jgi:hypothetical protein